MENIARIQVHGGMDRARGFGSRDTQRVPSAFHHPFLPEHGEARGSRHEEGGQLRAGPDNNRASAASARLQ